MHHRVANERLPEAAPAPAAVRMRGGGARAAPRASPSLDATANSVSSALGRTGQGTTVDLSIRSL